MRQTLTILLAALVGCAGWDPDEDQPSGAQASGDHARAGEVARTIRRFRARDPSMEKFFKSAYAYAVWPSVGKGGLGVGGAYGRGAVYEQGKLVGFTSLTQVTIGLQIGGQSYSEIIFFKDPARLREFQRGNFELGAQASAIAAESGASTDASYSRGVAIFTLPKAGLMAEASIGGQKFSYDPR